ncbi:hypothetical protein TNIN_138441 [Trichonephila inaurata madagascariensis]|uniref:Uncharacterized protein n=1 Tax=Trichonephila inaurata madagascariensis TaxID=2747483 RepID=A0A8X6X2Y2_9ARAC|nr:hypothetical protein TNIN_138441 [Trichonephila inaurata madagascariensis]
MSVFDGKCKEGVRLQFAANINSRNICSTSFFERTAFLSCCHVGFYQWKKKDNSLCHLCIKLSICGMAVGDDDTADRSEGR